MRNDRRAIVWTCLAIWLFAVGYAIITPPFQVPDEVAHYWHAVSLAHGNVFHVMQNDRMGTYVPKSARDFVYLTWVETAGKPENKIGMARLRAANELPYQPEPVFRSFPALYTPIPYLPGTLTSLVADSLHVRPLIAFYAGRIVTATACVLLIVAAMLECGELAAIIASIALLPMTLYMFGSFSADAVTISLAIYTTAVAWRARSDDKMNTRRWVRLCVAAAALALCKMLYAPLALLALAPRARGHGGSQNRLRRAISLFVSLAIGLALAAAMVSRQYHPLRPDANPKVQLQTIAAHPIDIASLIAKDFVAQFTGYRDQFVGRLGWVDVPLSGFLTVAAFYLLFVVALTRDVTITPAARLFALLLTFSLFFAVSLSQYVAWTPPGAKYVDGIQGRYFLPLAVVLLLPVVSIVRNKRVGFAALAVYALTAAAINIDAFVVLVKRYY
jgi:uncharacterized membrane protein